MSPTSRLPSVHVLRSNSAFPFPRFHPSPRNSSPTPPPFSTSFQFSPSSPSVNSVNSVLSIRRLIFSPSTLYLRSRLFTPILSLLTLHHLLLTYPVSSPVFSTLFDPSPFPSDWYPLSLSFPPSAPLPRSFSISFHTSFFVLFLPTLPFRYPIPCLPSSSLI
ncbi:hypothetical protein AYI69_g8386 [Smittium culicis]|uniref:Uncharacterized protein n=1 Tax=Smittium culicis TaxID=133412 RepID=A0A1R1XJV3_9FUNG|nr:hypothetical protein AYI69_g8386 [Smittium culicis]